MINLFRDTNIINIIYKPNQTYESLTDINIIATFILESVVHIILY
jgi:hypothetical protein